MASAYEIPNLRFAGEAGAVVARRRFVKINSTGAVVQAVAGDAVVGASSTEAKKSGEVVDIYDGIVIVAAGAAVTAGTQVQSDVDGKAITLAAGVKAGYAITGATAADQLISVKTY